MAADQLKPYHRELPESAEVVGECDLGLVTHVSLETGAIPKRAQGRHPKLRNEATAPAEPSVAVEEAMRTPRRGRGRPRKHP